MTIVLVLTAFGLFKKSPAGALVLLLVIGTSVWVYADARNLGVRRGIRPGKALDATPGQWFVFCLVFWIIFFPSYLATRPVYVARHRSNGRTIRN
ncbi:MAG TPA: hypothetical protein VMU64_13555 [Acidimicrobiales bacterium]|nr:hypothetical protein [Acidimicrobiales bacterium]